MAEDVAVELFRLRLTRAQQLLFVAHGLMERLGVRVDEPMLLTRGDCETIAKTVRGGGRSGDAIQRKVRELLGDAS